MARSHQSEPWHLSRRRQRTGQNAQFQGHSQDRHISFLDKEILAQEKSQKETKSDQLDGWVLS
jgi:hypothetical protein